MQVNNTWYTFFPNHESFRQAKIISNSLTPTIDNIEQDPEPRVSAAWGHV